jgi:hypothetical protein
MPVPAIIAGAAAVAGRVAAKKVAKEAAKKVAKKVATKAATKANARGLKAAQGPSLAKGSKKLEGVAGSVERAKTKMQAQDNMIAGATRKKAYGEAAKTADAARAAANAKAALKTVKKKGKK